MAEQEMGKLLEGFMENGLRGDSVAELKALLEKGANPDGGSLGINLMYAISDLENIQTKNEEDIQFDLISLLLESGADITFTTPDSFFGPGGYSALHNAAYYGRLPLCKLLIEKGFPVDGVPKDIQTPLHTATANGHLEVTKFLLEKGASLERTSFKGMTLLHWAVGNNREDIVEFLFSLEKEEDKKAIREQLEKKNAEGNTPVADAARLNSDKMKALLK
mmetsp:Transcript_22596/g.35146  ORF Transcript_22596/g.35146 Transcript_22596/m.35146 type:complete len:220 (-) Transcript_22596:15-674(-)